MVDGVPPPYDTRWCFEYDKRTADVVAAKLAVSLEPKPRTWPISGPLATEWNPDGHEPLSRRSDDVQPLGNKKTIEAP